MNRFSAHRWTVSVVALCSLTTQVHAQGAPPAPPAPPKPVCTRQSLQAATDSYLAAQKAGDRTKMTFAEKAKHLENMAAIEPGKGLWNTALPIAFSRSFLDKDRCKTFSEVIV